MTRRVRVVYGACLGDGGDPGVEIDTPYNLSFIEDLKSEVPARERAWNPDAKTWWVSAAFAEEAVEMVLYHYGETEVVDEDGAIEYRTPDGVVGRQEGLF